MSRHERIDSEMHIPISPEMLARIEDRSFVDGVAF